MIFRILMTLAAVAVVTGQAPLRSPSAVGLLLGFHQGDSPSAPLDTTPGPARLRTSGCR
jgi:hypothetical protein